MEFAEQPAPNEENIINILTSARQPSQPGREDWGRVRHAPGGQYPSQAASLGHQTLAANDGGMPMDDKDVRRLEDRIAASEERAQLRLEKFAERMEGMVARITDQTAAIREDGKQIRSEILQQRADAKGQFHWIIGTTIAVGLAAAGLVFGGLQIWGNGVQVGQVLQQQTLGAPPATTTPVKP